MNITNKAAAQDVVRDSVHLARIEGLEGHARAAECRIMSEDEVAAAAAAEEATSRKSKRAKK
jgi:hypothetical protein